MVLKIKVEESFERVINSFKYSNNNMYCKNCSDITFLDEEVSVYSVKKVW